MRLSVRTGRNSYISMGLIGWLFFSPFIICYYLLIGCGLVLWYLGKGTWWLFNQAIALSVRHG